MEYIDIYIENDNTKMELNLFVESEGSVILEIFTLIEDYLRIKDYDEVLFLDYHLSFYVILGILRGMAVIHGMQKGILCNITISKGIVV